MSKILLHSCCGPCSVYPLAFLRQEGFEVFGHFYNPNIHPFTEWKKRKENYQWFAEKENLKTIIEEDYALEEFLRNVVHRENNRCLYCYSMRLQRVAQIAKKGKFDAFTTTLLVSPFQKHALLKEVGEAVAAQYDIPFYYVDFRPGFKEGYMKAKETGHYLQQYCGCIYSERDRYLPRNPKLKGKKADEAHTSKR